MAELATLARPYARAAYEYAVEHKLVAEWNAMLHGLAVIAKDKRVRRYLGNPQLTAEQAVEIFFKIGKEVLHGAKAAGKNFLSVMADNKRLLLIPQVAELFVTMHAQDESLLEAEVTAAQPLSQAQKNKIKESLEKRFNKEVHLSCHTDASLLAGAIIRVEDFVIDGSARGKLQRMRNELT